MGITALGAYLPEKILNNHHLSEMVDTSDEWIQERTGIRERHIAAPDQACSDLAYLAFQDMKQNFQVKGEDVDLVLVATVTPDMIFPTTANILQHRIGATRAGSMDILAACSGFIYALSVGHQFVANGTCKNVLVFGSEVMSRIVNWEDRRTCVLFGDGAGVVLLQPVEEGYGILDTLLRSDGSEIEHLWMPAGGSRLPPSEFTIRNHLHSIHMNGREVFTWAIRRQGEIIEEILEKNHLHPEDIHLFAVHQANYRIIEGLWKRFHLPPEKFYINIHKYGNTTAASIPLVLYDACKEGLLHKGDLVLLAAFGAGFTWGASLIRWSLP
ncbi:MAG: beta-ketoacyl-ACP synthase III [bacterium]